MSRTAKDYRCFEIPGVAEFSETPAGLVVLALSPALCKAEIHLHGAHVTSFQPSGAQPVLFLSRRSQFEKNKPIRGGVPVIFPWFGPRAGHPESPAHGFARTLPWEVESLSCADGASVDLVLALESNESTRAIWPHDFVLRHRISVGSELSMTLEVVNTSNIPFTFEEALHTYFIISEIHSVTVTGLEGAEYLDKADGGQRKIQDRSPIQMSGEVDRLYLDTRTACAVHDPGMSRKIIVEKSGSDSTVVWNPAAAKAARLTDLGDEWPGMICIETVNAARNSVTLEAGATHSMRATVSLR